MTALFFYGTLRDLDLLATVLGHPVGSAVPARLPGYRVVWAQGEAFPMALPDANAEAEGLLVDGLDAQDLARLAFYEGGFSYATVTVQVTADGAVRHAQVFLPEPGLWQPGAPWSLADWQDRWGAVVRMAATEVMAQFGHMSVERVSALYGPMLTRAQARLNARASKGDSRSDQIEVIEKTTPYTGFFNLQEATLRFPRFDGNLSAPVHRAVFEMADAVTVLPYDPARDRVLLIEQFRVAPFLRGDPAPWLLEPVAGRVDAGEDYAQTARREAEEEARLTVTDLVEIARQYPSPGAVTEYLVSYIGICDLPDDAIGVGGLASEAEDIRSHIFDLETALNMADSGQIRATPLLMSLYWLSRHRDRLRAGPPL